MLRGVSLLALLLLFFVVLLANAPARLLPRLLGDTPLQLEGLGGSVWQGSASRALLLTSAGPLQLGQLEWRLSPASLLTLAPTIAVESHWGDQNARAEVTIHGGDDLSLRDVDVTVDAALIQQLVPVAMEGRLTLTARHIRVTGGRPVQAEGRLVWEQGMWNAPRARLPLGSYVLEFSRAAGSEPLNGEVLTLAGPVQAQGTARLDDNSYALDLRIRGDEVALDPVLIEALSLMARPDGRAFHLQLNGAL